MRKDILNTVFDGRLTGIYGNMNVRKIFIIFKIKD